MSLSARRLRSAFLGCGLLAATAPVLAQGSDALELRWTAPEGCPQSDAIRARVRELTGEGVHRSLAADGVIEPAEARFRLTLVIRDGAAESERVLESDSCADLGGAAAVALSLLLRGSPATGTEGSTPTAAPNAGTTTKTPELSAAKPPAKPTVPQPARRAAPAAANADAATLRIGVRAPVVTLDVGPLPRPSFGIAAGAGIHLDAWSLFALGQVTAKQHIPSDAFPGYGAEVSRVAGSLWACRGFRAGRAELAPCVLLWLSHLRARGTGADLVTARARRTTWASPAFGAVGHYHLLDWLAVFASASGRVEGARPRLSVVGLGEIHRLGPAALTLAAGMEWIF